MELGYNNALTGVTATAAYNGNISATKWSNDLGQETSGYGYSYDAMNRLTGADYHKNAVNTPDFDVSYIAYDLNGNIDSLSRNGKGGVIDQLSYEYVGNQLQYVEDPTAEAQGFINGHIGSNGNEDYLYDANGNMTRDLNKDITWITYNHLNLPETVEKGNGELLSYTYDAAGMKLQQEVHSTILQDTSYTPSELISWNPALTARSVIDAPVSEGNRVLRVYANGSHGLHRIHKYMAPLQGKRVRVKAKLYLPSGNTNVDGVQVYVGDYPGSIYTATDQWIDVTFFLGDKENTNDGFVSFFMLSGSERIFAGADSATDDLFYIKDIEITTVEPIKTTDYIGEYIYEDDELELIQHEEGRIVFDPVTEAPDYQYYLKDHLGNTRVTFTTKPKSITFKTNYEGTPDDDQSLFEDVTTVSNDIFDHTDELGTTYTHAQLLNGTEGSRVGSVIAIPVGMGDTLNAKVYAKYVEVTANPTGAVTNLATSIINAFTGGIGGTHELGNQSINNNFGSGSLIGTPSFPADGGSPMAFLNVMFLPEGETITLDNSSFAYDQISTTASQQVGQPKNTNYDELSVTDFIAPSQGYVLVYLSNESSTIAEVYFDDLEIEVKEHPIIQTADYYPYGMQTAGGYQRITAKGNNYLYNGFELQKSLDWGVYDYLARYYDPAIGRFLQVDPAADLMRRHSPYNYAFDNPIRFIDPDGMIPAGVNDPPFNRSNVRKVGGRLIARRMTTGERKSFNVGMAVASTFAPGGAVIGVGTEISKASIGENNTAISTTAQAGTIGTLDFITDAGSKDAMVGQNRGMLKSANSIVKKIGRGLGLLGAVTEMASDATPQEVLEETTFAIAVKSDLGALNIANEGVLNFNDDSLNEDQAIQVLNNTYNGLSQVLSQFDLTNSDDLEVAQQYLKDNFQQIVKDINNLSNQQ
ncbi:RHS repeat-associated core domain-containing protein [Fulvivirga sp. M361]|nr:RHS repeat-associated core domain-containing protein [Fulvivirga sp. M361]